MVSQGRKAVGLVTIRGGFAVSRNNWYIRKPSLIHSGVQIGVITACIEEKRSDLDSPGITALHLLHDPVLAFLIANVGQPCWE